MADPKIELESLIAENKGTLVRQKKHKIYRFPNGSTLVVSSTPECPFAYDNQLAHLKRLLGIYPPHRGAPGTRRNKRLKQKTSGSSLLPFENHENHGRQQSETWKDKLATITIPPPPPPPKRHKAMQKPITFEEQMLKAGVKKLAQNG